MTKKHLKDTKLVGFSKNEIQDAQSILDTLCAEYGLPSWPITSRNGDWRALVFRQCGLKMEHKQKKKRGRPKDYTDGEKLEIAKEIEMREEFGRFDPVGNDTGKGDMLASIYDAVADKYDVKSKISASNRQTSPRNTLRRLRNDMRPVLDKEWKDDVEALVRMEETRIQKKSSSQN